MTLVRRGFAISLLALSWASSLAVAQASAADLQLTPLAADVLSPPLPVMGSDARRHLVYELRLANTTGGEAQLKSVEVIDRASGKVLLGLDRGDIGKHLSLGGRRGAESADLGAAQFGVLFLHVALDAGDAVPRTLAHRVAGHFAQPGIDFTMTVADVTVADRPPVVLGPPLMGTGYLAGDGCCDTIRHVRALLTLDGRFALAQRFAIDWEQADARDRLVSGDPKVLTNYTIFGKAVLAVAAGTVVAARNDLAEQVPGALPAGLPLDEVDGNFVVLDIGGGAYVNYAHMQPGSVTVAAGAKVGRGDVLGKVGNSGNSQAPHLHLHVMDGPSPLLSNGLPYVFDQFTLLAIDQAGTADFDKAEATGSPLTLTPQSPPQRLRNALPLDLSVVAFTP